MESSRETPPGRVRHGSGEPGKLRSMRGEEEMSVGSSIVRSSVAVEWFWEQKEIYSGWMK